MKQIIFNTKEFIEIYNKLYLVSRTGWVNRGVKNPESVGEHCDSLVALVDAFCDNLTIQDPEKLKDMLKIHDLAEIIVGDQVVADIKNNELYHKTKEVKKMNEEKAMQEIVEKLGSEGSIILEYWKEFEDNKTYDANIGHQLDQYQAIQKAFEYEQLGESVRTIDFIEYVESKKYISHPFLVSKVLEIKKEAKK